jgi:hypothetical protein
VKDRTFTDRGIGDEVHDRRGYRRFERGDFAAAFRADPTFAVPRTFVKWSRQDGQWVSTAEVKDLSGQVKWRTDRTGGYVIPLFAAPGLGLEKPVARFKLDAMSLPRSHDHSKLGPYSRRAHVEKRHGGVDVDGAHSWSRDARYMGMAGVEDKRIDVHPLAADRLAGAERVWFSIEGSLKSDSILTRILREGRPESTFAVPSVTMWRAPELGNFVERWLRGMQIIIVSDSDWARNPMVALQAFACREWFREQGVAAHVAAAPPGPDGEKGVDDFLGREGSLDDMVVLRREPSPGFADFLWRGWGRSQFARGRGVEAATRDARVLRFLALRANEDGLVLRPSAELIAKYAGIEPQSVGRIVARLVEQGALTPDTLDLRYGERFMRVPGRRKPLYQGHGWEEQPSFLIHPDLRADSHETKLFAMEGIDAEISQPVEEAVVATSEAHLVTYVLNGRRVARRFLDRLAAIREVLAAKERGATGVQLVSYLPPDPGGTPVDEWARNAMLRSGSTEEEIAAIEAAWTTGLITVYDDYPTGEYRHYERGFDPEFDEWFRSVWDPHGFGG